MELRVLQYFLAVAKEQSISAAAQSLHLTQPTLSRQIKELEDNVVVLEIAAGVKIRIRQQQAERERVAELAEVGVVQRKQQRGYQRRGLLPVARQPSGHQAAEQKLLAHRP